MKVKHHKLYLVCFKEYAHGPKVLNASKGFMDKQEAQDYMLRLNKDLRKYDNDDMSYWLVKEIEIE